MIRKNYFFLGPTNGSPPNPISGYCWDDGTAAYISWLKYKKYLRPEAILPTQLI